MEMVRVNSEPPPKAASARRIESVYSNTNRIVNIQFHINIRAETPNWGASHNQRLVGPANIWVEPHLAVYNSRIDVNGKMVGFDSTISRRSPLNEGFTVNPGNSDLIL
jgi:hypothetical protein